MLENLVILTEFEYNLKNGQKGEVDRAYINPILKYAYVIEYKSKDSEKTKAKAKQQCHKDIEYINEVYQIDKNRIFCFEAFGKGKKDFEIKRVR